MKVKHLTISILLLLLLLAHCGSDNNRKNNNSGNMSNSSSISENVWICNGKTSKKYHSNSNCQGLRNCTHDLIEVSGKEAEEEYSRRPCKLCY